MFFKKYKVNSIVCLFVFFIISVLILFLVSDFPKALTTYPDERHLYELAKNIYLGNGLEIHNVVSPYSKILYPLILVPFFAINDIAMRIKMIGLFNCVLLSSSVFPTYLISKKINLNMKFSFLCCLLVCISPFMLFSGTFMAECLLYPLTLWFVLFVINYLSNRTYLKAALIGLFSYLLFLCKEHAVAFLFSFVIVELFNMIKHKNKMQIIFKCGLCMFVFATAYVLFKFTLFKDLGHYYSRQLVIFSNFKLFLFGFYAFLYFCCAVPLVSLIVPFVLPFAFVRRFDEKTKQLFIFALSLFIFICGVTAFFVSTVDSGMQLIPATEIRYFFPVNILLIIIMFKCLDLGILNLKSIKTISICMLIYLLFFALVYKGGTFAHTNLPGFNLQLYAFVFDLFKSLFGSSYIFYICLVLFNFLICVLVFFLFRKILFSHKIAFYNISIIVSSLISFSTGIYFLRRDYFLDYQEANDIMRLDNYLSSKKATKKLFLYKNGGRATNYLDTFFENSYKGSMFVAIEDFDKQVKEQKTQTMRVCEINFIESCSNTPYKNVDSINYFVLNKNIEIDYSFDERYITKVSDFNSKNWELYFNKTPQYINLIF